MHQAPNLQFILIFNISINFTKCQIPSLQQLSFFHSEKDFYELQIIWG